MSTGRMTSALKALVAMVSAVSIPNRCKGTKLQSNRTINPIDTESALKIIALPVEENVAFRTF